MALKTTLGSKTANSFITIVEADAYLAASPYDDAAWLALSTAEKEYRLILAAKYMRNKLSWLGWEVYENQYLPFPRYTGPIAVELPDDFVPEVPADIKMAQAFIAYDMIHRGLVGITAPSLGGASEPEIKSLDLFGRLKVTTSDVAAKRTDGSAIEQQIASEHFHVNMLLEDYAVQISMTPAVPGPTKLTEVA